jgi:hypothetical protein
MDGPPSPRAAFLLPHCQLQFQKSKSPRPVAWGLVLLNRPSSSGIRPLSFVQQPADLRKHLVQHPLGQPAGLGILAAGVVGGDQRRQRGLQAVAGPVLEGQAGEGCALLLQQPPVAVESDLAQGQHHAG